MARGAGLTAPLLFSFKLLSFSSNWILSFSRSSILVCKFFAVSSAVLLVTDVASLLSFNAIGSPLIFAFGLFSTLFVFFLSSFRRSSSFRCSRLLILPFTALFSFLRDSFANSSSLIFSRDDASSLSRCFCIF